MRKSPRVKKSAKKRIPSDQLLADFEKAAKDWGLICQGGGHITRELMMKTKRRFERARRALQARLTRLENSRQELGRLQRVVIRTSTVSNR